MAVIVGTGNSDESTSNHRKLLRTSNGTLWAFWYGSILPSLYYSTNDGVAWSAASTAFPEKIKVAQYSSWKFCEDGFIYIIYVNPSDDIVVRRGTLDGPQTDIEWSASVLVKTGIFKTHTDIVAYVEGGSTRVHVTYGDSSGVNEHKHWLWGGSPSSAVSINSRINQQRINLDFAHTQADPRAVLSSAPHLFAVWWDNLSDDLKFKKATFSAGPSWSWGTERTITTDAHNSQVDVAAVFDGTVIVMAVRSQTTTSQILVFERDAADTTTTAITDPPARTGTATARIALSYNPDRGIELFHADSSADTIEHTTYDRSEDSWSAWESLDTGSDDGWPNAKIGYWSGTKNPAVDVIWTSGSGSPFDIKYERFEFAAPVVVAAGWGRIPIGG